MNEVKRAYPHAIEEKVYTSEVDIQLENLSEANSRLHSIVTDLEAALNKVLRSEYTEKCSETAPEQPLVPVANVIRNQTRGIEDNVDRIRNIIGRLGI